MPNENIKHYTKSTVISMDEVTDNAQIDLLMELVEKIYCIDMDKKCISVTISVKISDDEKQVHLFSVYFKDFSELRFHMTNYLRMLATKLMKVLPYKMNIDKDYNQIIEYDFYYQSTKERTIKCQYAGQKDWSTQRECGDAPHGVIVDDYCTNCNEAKAHICEYGLIAMKPDLTKEEMESKAEEDCAKIFNFKGGLKSKLTKDLLSKDDDDALKRYRMLGTKNRDIVRTLINRFYDLQKL